MSRVRVCISFDIEPSIAGAFENSDVYQPVGKQNVYCNVNGKSEGLEFILNTLNLYEIKATFFVEALNRAYFGDGTMQAVVNDILSAGQDVQLHVHPVWRQIFSSPNWKEDIQAIQPDDSVSSRSQVELESILNEGIEDLERWCGYRPQALRTGNLHVSRDVYKAMRATGLTISSNIGTAIFTPHEPELRLTHGCSVIEGIYEYPVTTYAGLRFFRSEELKCLTIIGSSFSEIKQVLEQAYRYSIKSIVILSHPSEFIKGYDIQIRNAKANKLAQGRFRNLCKYLAGNRDRFQSSFITNLQKEECGSNCQLMSTSNLSNLTRIVENKLGQL